MKNILTNNRDLFNYINSSNSEKRNKLLSNDTIKLKFIVSNDIYAFIWLIQALNQEELETFLDEKGIDILINSKNIVQKLIALITLDCNINYKVLSNPKIMQKIIDNKEELSTYLTSVNVLFIEQLFIYVVNNSLDFNIILSCKKNLLQFLKNEANLELIKQKKLINENNFHNLEKNSIEFLLNDIYFQKIILKNNYNVQYFDQIIMSDVRIPNEILTNKEFIDKIINNRNVSNYRFLLEEIEKTSNIYLIKDIEIKREKKYDDLINTYDNSLNMFEKYKNILNSIFKNNELINQTEFFQLDINQFFSFNEGYDITSIYFNHDMTVADKFNKIKNILTTLTNKEFKEILIDRFFKEVPYNFLLNLNTLIEFNEKNDIINADNLKRYIAIQQNDCFDKELYDSFDKNENYVTQFYDDFKKSKEYAYQSLKESLVDINKIENQKSKSLSQIYNVPIYEFNGEPFYLLIHNTSKPINTDGYYLHELFHENKKNDGISLSLISNEKMNYYNDYQKSIIFGFKEIDIKQIVHLYNSDSYSFYKYEDNRVSNRITKLYLPTDLIKDTYGYNEIVYQEKTKNTQFLNIKELTPDYLVCFDYVSDSEAKIAKYYNIPIIKINKNKYNIDNNNIKNKSINALLKDGGNESYINSYFELKNKFR